MFMTKKRVLNLFFTALICLSCITAFAGKEAVSFYQRISKINSNSFTLQENKYLNPAFIYSGASRNAIIKNSFAKISLRLFDTVPFVSVPNQDIFFEIKAYDYNGAIIGGTIYKKLNVSNSLTNFGHNLEDKKDFDMFIVNGAHKVDVKIVADINGNPFAGTFANLASNLAFEIEIETDRYYLFNASTPLSSSQIGHNEIINTYSSKPEELEVYWDNIPGVEEYDLEWAFVDDYGTTLTTFQTGSAINNKVITFKGNSTRITTSNNFYRIPIVFEHGYIVYRVRGVGRSLNNPDIILEGNWSLADNQTLGSYLASSSNVYQNINNVHETDGKNWQYNATFAEEGKRKHTVTYADGTLRSRQIITQNNSDKTVIVGESIYDFQGRKAIEIMPVPDPNGENKFQYHSKFSQNASGSAYTKNDFDFDSGEDCSVGAPPLGINSGAGKYYSPNNILSNPHRPYTPDAFGYAFTQTEFKPDNTGRIKKQGGVGDNHHIGSGHETKYLYGSPDQEELDAMFGTEVGNYVHYQKNVVIDANGQASISYVDLKGKTIATALAGNQPAGMTRVNTQEPSEFNATYINDETGNDAINGNSMQGNSLVFNKKIVIESTTTYTINYDVVPTEFSQSCVIGPNVCYDCVYDLNLSLKDECGLELIPATTNIQGYFSASDLNGHNALVGDVNAVSSPLMFHGFKDDGCSNSNNKYTTNAIELTLAPGEYMLSKTLTVDNNAMEFYLAQYLSSNCIKQLSDFENEAELGMDTTGCNVPCLECLERTSLCEANYRALLSDVSLGGQYAEYEINNGVVTASGALSLLNTSNSFPKISGDAHLVSLVDASGYKPNWKNPIINGQYWDYEYANGLKAYVPVNPADYSSSVLVPLSLDNATGYLIYNASGNITGVKVKDLKDLTAFKNAWDPNFARFLVEYHPEFAYYQFCITQSGTSEHYFPKKIVNSATPPSQYASLSGYRTNFEQQWKGQKLFTTKSLQFNAPTAPYTTVIQTNPTPRTLTSEEFDEQLRTYVTSISDLAIFCPACTADILSTSGTVITNDLINIDPMFNMNSTTNPLIAQKVFGDRSLEILCYYRNKLFNMIYFPSTVNAPSGIQINNVKQALMLSIPDPACNFQNVFYPTSASSAGCGLIINNDDIWNRYKDFYLSNKRQILMEMADEFAKVPEYSSYSNNNFNYIYDDIITPDYGNFNPNNTYFNQLVGTSPDPNFTNFSIYPGASTPTHYRLIKGYNGCIGNGAFDPNASDFIRKGFNPKNSNMPISAGATCGGVSGPFYVYPHLFEQVLGFNSNYYNNFAAYLTSGYPLPWSSPLSFFPKHGWGFYDRGQTCNADLASSFAAKTKRFQSGLGYAQQAYGTSASSAADLSAILGSQVSYQNQQLSGICPLANDFTSLLNNLVQGIPSGGTNPYNLVNGSPLWIFPSFTKLLYDNIIDNMGACANSYVFLETQLPSPPSNILSLDLYGNNTNALYPGIISNTPVSGSPCAKCSDGNLVTLKLPTSAAYAFADIVSIDKIFNIAGTDFSLQIHYAITSGGTTTTYTDVITGTTCLPLDGCASDPAPVVCEPKDFSKDLVKLLSAIGAGYDNGAASPTYYNDMSNSGVELNGTGAVNYSSSFTNNILLQLGGAASSSYTWKWTQISNGNYQIYSNSSSNTLDISIFTVGGGTALTILNGYGYTFTNLRDVSGQAQVDVTTTDLSTNASSVASYVISVQKNPGSTNVALFDCHPMMDPLCNTTENKNYEDLKPFLAEIFPLYYLSDGVSADPSYNYDISNLNSFTNSLKSQLPGGVNGTYFLSRPELVSPNVYGYKIGMLKPLFSESACLTTLNSSQWSYSDVSLPECIEVVCDIQVKDISPGYQFTSTDWAQVMDLLFIPSTITGTKNTNTLCGEIGIYDGKFTILKKLEITTCWNAEKCCNSNGLASLPSLPSANCSTEYSDFVSDLNALVSSANNIVTNASAPNATSSSPYLLTDSYVSQSDFCNNAYYYNHYINYVNYYTAIVTKINTLNATLPASMDYVSPLTDPSSKFFFSIGDFTSANIENRLAQYFNYLNSYTLPADLTTFDPSNLQNLPEFIAAHNADCSDDCSTVLNPGNIPTEPAGWNTDCVQELANLAAQNALVQYQQYINFISAEFRNAYRSACLQVKENLNTRYYSDRYHYTLYYYDQAGNLIKTVPPNGVALFTSAQLAQVVSDRNFNATATTPILNVPQHSYSTLYKYNSLNQLTEQTMPDHDYYTSDFYYDKLGRLILSQNPKQKHSATPAYPGQQQYSYTKYDHLGRINEVAELNAMPSSLSSLITSGSNQITNALAFNSLVASNTKQQITKTLYDYASMPSTNFQNDLMRGRVAKTSIDANGDGVYETANHFSYDVHGNVKSMINEFNYAQYENIANKRIDYEYDLISGKVNSVAYQKGLADQYYHNYYYDADNRLIEVQTSKDGYIWNKDAKYYYYLHGPLARTELGDRKVQAQDFYYTLQGWIKGVNGEAITRRSDPGKDGYLQVSSSDPYAYLTTTQNIHSSVGIDAFAYSLGYYENDGVHNKDYVGIYNAGSGAYNSNLDPFASLQNFIAGGTLATAAPNLYNGNIKHMGTTIVTDPMYISNYYQKGYPLLQTFTYDQLNRITGSAGSANYTSAGSVPMCGFSSGNNKWSTTYAINQLSNYTYDPNGNIQTLARNSFTDGLFGISLMDALEYKYIKNPVPPFRAGTNTNNGYNTNKLEYVDENHYTGGSDFSDQNPLNYGYDEIGNLIRDDQEFNNNIHNVNNVNVEWNVYGKISKITNTGSSNKSDLEFRYDSKGDRIMKIVKERVSGVLKTEDQWKRTVYVRDAQGNVMSTYNITFTNPSGDDYVKEVKLSESHMYGSSRLGTHNRTTENISDLLNITSSSPDFSSAGSLVYNASTPATSSLPFCNRELGYKSFELSNHLGNVMTVVSDKKIAVDAGTPFSTNLTYSAPFDNVTDYYIADITSATDYYPFGSPMPGRKYQSSANKYRYGFNGKENDPETVGTGQGTQDYGARIYNPSLGKFLSVDPLTGGFPYWSPYHFAGNNPIVYIDLDGQEIAKPTMPGFGMTIGYTTDNAVKSYMEARRDHPGAPSWKIAAFATGNGLKNLGVDIMSMSDVDDAVILGTMITRGTDAIDLKGNKTTSVDKGFAIAGAFIPFASGSLIKKIMSPILDAGGEVVVRQFKNIEKVSNKPWYKYQQQINGLGGNIEINFKGVLFDGLKDGKLLEAKGLGYDKLLKNEKFGDRVMDKLMDQARRQVDAAGGTPLEWHFAEKGAADAFSKELKQRGIEGIDVKHTPMDFSKK